MSKTFAWTGLNYVYLLLNQRPYMFVFKYNLSNPVNWHKDMEQQIPTMVRGKSFLLKSHFGSGGATYKELQPGLWIEQMNFKLKNRLEVEVLPKPQNDAFFITFWRSSAKVVQNVEGQSYELDLDNVSVVFISSATSTRYDFPGENKNIDLFMIWVTRDWLLKTVFDEEPCELKKVISADNPIYLSENMDYKFKTLLDDLNFENANKLELFTSVFQLLNHFFKNIENQNINNIAALNIHKTDVKNLMDVRAYIHAHPLDDISLDSLSRMANMSLSKFKRLFKQMFGTTPYRYWLNNKMEIAKQTLLKEEHSVSHTGFMIGYSNLSQFSKAFKSHFGFLPSEIRA